MICDWLGAGIVYSKQKVDFNKPYSEPLEYYKKFTNERIFHPETQKLIEYFLMEIKENGINYFCKNIKEARYYKVSDYNGEYLP